VLTSTQEHHFISNQKENPLYFFPSLSLSWNEGVNFTNILRTALLYKSFVRSFFVLEVKVKHFIGARKLAQLRS
jgi:hypothetical protein